MKYNEGRYVLFLHLQYRLTWLQSLGGSSLRLAPARGSARHACAERAED